MSSKSTFDRQKTTINLILVLTRGIIDWAFKTPTSYRLDSSQFSYKRKHTQNTLPRNELLCQLFGGLDGNGFHIK